VNDAKSARFVKTDLKSLPQRTRQAEKPLVRRMGDAGRRHSFLTLRSE
jgi:hypothetical protein